MKRVLKWLWGANVSAALLLIALTLGEGGGVYAREVRIAQGVDVRVIHPHMTNTQSDLNVILHIYDPLVRRNDQMRLEPALALSWYPVDRLTWRFELRRNVYFHNGERFDAADVKYTLEQILDPSTGSVVRPWLKLIDRVTVVDPYTVEIHTSAPFPALPSQLSSIGIIPDEFTKKNGYQALARTPVGTGPYKFVEWVKDSYVLLERNPAYWGGVPKYERLRFYAIPETSTRISALLTGEVDIAAGVPPHEVDRIQSRKGLLVKTVPSTRAIFVKFNTLVEPMKDRRVRLAINYAIDKQEIVDAIFKGGARLLQGQVLTPEYFGFNPELKPFPYDPQKARVLLAEAGYPNGFEVEFDTPSGRYLNDREVAEAVSGQLARVGIRARVVTLEWGVFMNKYIGSGQLAPLALLGQSWPTLDADGLLSLFEPGNPYAYYENSEVKELLAKARTTVDPEERSTLYHQITRVMYDDPPGVWLYQQTDIYGVRENVEWSPRPDQVIWLFRSERR